MKSVSDATVKCPRCERNAKKGSGPMLHWLLSSDEALKYGFVDEVR